MSIENLAKILLFHRKKSGLSQLELANLAGLGKTVIYDLEKGKTSIRWDTLLKVMKVLNIKVELHSPLMQMWEEEQ